ILLDCLNRIIPIQAAKNQFDEFVIRGKVFNIKKIDSSLNTVTIAASSGTTIDGAASRVLLYANDSVSVVSDGTNFFLI
ncbi:hypothetical protein EBU99_14470, partial [bacterium]|nr:hypothetical protein [bacterium]